MKNGKLQLTGVEVAVPIALWTGSERPSLFGKEFNKTEDHGVYGFHMWVWKPNPDGILAFYDSEVSCEFDE